jgi:GT2 family glycosyltransferase
MMNNPALTASDASSDAVWLIIPVHNRCSITRRILGHLDRLGVATWAKVLVVDDGSSDGTAAMLNNEFPWVKSLRGPGDWWWGGAVRAGMELAIKGGAECICWVNDDTLPAAGSLERLVEMACTRAAMVGGVSQTEHPSGFAYGGGQIIGGWPKALNPMPKADENMTQVAWLHGNLVAISARVWQQIGLPDVRWAKHHFADVSYALTAHRAGLEVLLLPSATAEASWNGSGNYLSWRDSQLSVRQLLFGFWDPRMWWYLPGVVFYQWHFFGWEGVWRLFFLISKAVLILVLKCLQR